MGTVLPVAVNGYQLSASSAVSLAIPNRFNPPTDPASHRPLPKVTWPDVA